MTSIKLMSDVYNFSIFHASPFWSCHWTEITDYLRKLNKRPVNTSKFIALELMIGNAEECSVGATFIMKWL